MTEEFVRYLEMCVNFHHENDESFKITDRANAKENLMYLKAIHYINELYSDVEENHTIEQSAGENQIGGGVVSISGSSIDAFRCWKCGRIFPISERTDIVYTSNPPKNSCKECERIKKEKQYRPFNNCNELIEYWYDFTGVINCSPKLFMATIWVKHKRCETENLIIAFDNDNESIGGSCVFVQDMWVDMKELFDNFTFLDGSPCGLEE